MSRRANRTLDKKQKTRKKKSIFKSIIKTIIVLVIIGAILIGGAYYYLQKVLAKMQGETLQATELNKEEDIYEKVATTLTKKEFDKVVTIAIFGVDSRDALGENIGSRSDTIMVASLNPTNKSVKLISIPRDTYVTLPGYGKDKINAAYSYGREKLAIKTINYNFGLAIGEYVTVDFEQVIDIVNELDGAEVTIDEQERTFINKWSKVSYKLSGRKYETITKTGLINLTGEQALAHMRNRDSARGDFDRIERQREVMTTLMNKVSKMSLVEILKLSDTVFKGIKTNIVLNNYLSYIPTMLRDKDLYLQNIVSVQFPDAEYASDKRINGLYYFVPDKAGLKEKMYDIIYNK